mmetsp:Transcript_26278/g.66289  ORF Transcript_26278/g.66289 Transcript_26278/m.66289 type:complete len:223 (+) Transcript_26278:593-1261(+)
MVRHILNLILPHAAKAQESALNGKSRSCIKDDRQQHCAQQTRNPKAFRWIFILVLVASYFSREEHWRPFSGRLCHSLRGTGYRLLSSTPFSSPRTLEPFPRPLAISRSPLRSRDQADPILAFETRRTEKRRSMRETASAPRLWSKRPMIVRTIRQLGRRMPSSPSTSRVAWPGPEVVPRSNTSRSSMRRRFLGSQTSPKRHPRAALLFRRLCTGGRRRARRA